MLSTDETTEKQALGQAIPFDTKKPDPAMSYAKLTALFKTLEKRNEILEERREVFLERGSNSSCLSADTSKLCPKEGFLIIKQNEQINIIGRA